MKNIIFFFILLLLSSKAYATKVVLQWPSEDHVVVCQPADHDARCGQSTSSGTVTQVNTSAPITGGPITTTGTVGITQSGSGTNGYLSSTDWNTFNNKTTLSGMTTNKLQKATSSSTIGDSQAFDNGTNIGLGSITPGSFLDIQGQARMTGFQLSTNPTASYVLTANSVGVGTWAPAPSGGGGGSGTVGIGTVNRMVIQIGSTTTGTPYNTTAADGAVGIGTTNVQQGLYNNTTSGIGLIKTRSTDAGGAARMELENDITDKLILRVQGSTNSPETRILATSQTVPFNIGTSPQQDVYLSTNGFTALTVDGFSQNIGIGTVDPVQKLEVVGTSQMTGFKLTTNPAASYVLTSNTVGVGTWMPIQTTASGNVGIGTIGRLAVYTAATTVGSLGTPTLCSAGSYPLGIDSSGNVVSCTAAGGGGTSQWITGAIGIGTTSNVGIGTLNSNALLTVGANRFQVNALGNVTYNQLLQANAATNAIIQNVSTASGSQTVIIGSTGDSSNLVLRGSGSSSQVDTNIKFNYGNSGTEGMRFNIDGNLGIGSTAPGTILDVVGTTRTTGFQLPTSPTNGYVLTSDANGVGSWAAGSSGASSQWLTTSVGIGTYGNVGVGTITPAAKLIITGGNVGIGSLHPGTNLDVSGVTRTAGFRVTGNNQNTDFQSVWEGNSSNTTGFTGVMDFETSLNLNSANSGGVGLDIEHTVNSPNDGTPRTFTNTYGMFVGYSTNNNGVDTFTNLYDIYLSDLGTGTNDYGLYIDRITGGTSKNYELFINSTNRLVINNTGNLGIGTINPGTPLDVNGTSRMTGFQLTTNPGSGFVLNSNSVGVGTWVPGAITAIPGGGVNAVQYNNGTTFAGIENKFSFNGTNVGLGTTNGALLLDVRNGNVGIGSVNPTKSAVLEVTSASLSAFSSWKEIMQLNSYPGDPSPFVVSGVGGTTTNVGIGTINTIYFRLEVNGDVNTTNSYHLQDFTHGNDWFLADHNGAKIGNGVRIDTNSILMLRDLGASGAGPWPNLSSLQRSATITGNLGSFPSNFFDGAALTGSGKTINTYGTVWIEQPGTGGVNKPTIVTNAALYINSGDIILNTGNIGIGTQTVGNIGIGTTMATNGIVLMQGANLGIGTWVPTSSLSVMVGNIGIGTIRPGAALDINGNIRLNTAGNSISIKTGSNACKGQSTLSGGTVTVSTTCTPSTAEGIFLTDATTGSLVNIGTPTVGTITGGTSFVINSSNALDASNVNWVIFISN